MSNNVERLEEELRDIIAKILEVDRDKVGLDVMFVEDLNMESISALEILAAIEKRYRIQIPEDKLVKMASLRDVVEITKNVLSSR